jgi:hypothetical protein
MRILTTFFVSILAFGCGGSDPAPAEVGDLTDTSQVNLCRDFVEQLCDNTTNPDADDFCNNTCITDTTASGVPQSCIDASDSGAIDGECDLILVSEVEECFTTGDLDLCAEAGGGCLFDALETICP